MVSLFLFGSLTLSSSNRSSNLSDSEPCTNCFDYADFWQDFYDADYDYWESTYHWCQDNLTPCATELETVNLDLKAD